LLRGKLAKKICFVNSGEILETQNHSPFQPAANADARGNSTGKNRRSPAEPASKTAKNYFLAWTAFVLPLRLTLAHDRKLF
jgi:hypothetical protein